MFAELNPHAVAPPQSPGTVYNFRDPGNDLVLKLSLSVPMFQDRVEFEKVTVYKRSTKLFTLSEVYRATRGLLEAYGRVLEDSSELTTEDRQLAAAYWTYLGDVIPEWQLLRAGRLGAAELRAKYVHSDGIGLQALGRAGGALVRKAPRAWTARLRLLGGVDWRRTNASLWADRAPVSGKVREVRRSVLLTANVIKHSLGLPLSMDEAAVEAQR